MVDISNMKSPGVFVDEVDLSQYAALRSESKVIAILGFGRKGTPNEVTHVSNFKDTFGDPLSSDYGALTALYTLEIVPEILYVRMADTATLAARTVTLAGKDSSSDDVDNALIIAFKDKGTLFDEAVKATVTAGSSANKFVLKITKDDGKIFLNKEFSTTSTDPNYIGTAEDDTFSFTYDNTAVTINAVTNASFSAGNDGVSINSTQFDACCELLKDRDSVDVDIVGAPGRYLSTDISSLLSIGTTRKDCVVILDHPQGCTSQQVADFFNGTTITVGGVSYSAPYCNTTYAAMWSPWCKVFNPTLESNQWVPPSVAIIPALALEYSNSRPWEAPAGIPRFEVTLTNETERVLTQSDRDILYSNNVNPICNYKNLGWTALGQKTSQRALSSTNRLNVRFLANYVKKIAEFSTVGFLFMDIDESTFDSWKKEIGDQLDQIKSEGGIYDYQIKMDWDTNTTDLTNNNIMYGIIKIKPTKVADYIAIDVELLNREDEF